MWNYSAFSLPSYCVPPDGILAIYSSHPTPAPQFVYETYLYHLVRKDNRHNFSVYFYHLYLRFELPAAGATSLLAFVPQVLGGLCRDPCREMKTNSIAWSIDHDESFIVATTQQILSTIWNSFLFVFHSMKKCCESSFSPHLYNHYHTHLVVLAHGLTAHPSLLGCRLCSCC
jgi:hypothetical protein